MLKLELLSQREQTSPALNTPAAPHLPFNPNRTGQQLASIVVSTDITTAITAPPRGPSRVPGKH